MYILYGGRFTRALIVEMVLAEGDLDYELREVDIIAGQHRARDYLALNPTGGVPTLITPEGDVLYETPAINLYLAERHNLLHIAPSADDAARGPFLSGLFYLTSELEPALKRHFYPNRYVVQQDDCAAMKSNALKASLGCLNIIDKRLAASGPFHLGERFSLVDLMLAFWVTSIGDQDRLADLAAARNCVDSVAARPKLRSRFDDMRNWICDYAELQTRGEGVV